MTKTGIRAATLWIFSVCLASLLRYAGVIALGIWTPDGRLAVPVSTYTWFNTAYMAAIGATFWILFYHSRAWRDR